MAEVIKLPFVGEDMNCVMCGAKEKSDPLKESGWRALMVNGTVYYVCPSEFPPDGSSQIAFADAYTRVLTKILAVDTGS